MHPVGYARSMHLCAGASHARLLLVELHLCGFMIHTSRQPGTQPKSMCVTCVYVSQMTHTSKQPGAQPRSSLALSPGVCVWRMCGLEWLTPQLGLALSPFLTFAFPLSSVPAAAPPCLHCQPPAAAPAPLRAPWPPPAVAAGSQCCWTPAAAVPPQSARMRERADAGTPQSAPWRLPAAPAGPH
eukprot:scaffold273224_cov21-Tisochrysis_lutea.AAC.2